MAKFGEITAVGKAFGDRDRDYLVPAAVGAFGAREMKLAIKPPDLITPAERRMVDARQNLYIANRNAKRGGAPAGREKGDPLSRLRRRQQVKSKVVPAEQDYTSAMTRLAQARRTQPKLLKPKARWQRGAAGAAILAGAGGGAYLMNQRRNRYGQMG